MPETQGNEDDTQLIPQVSEGMEVTSPTQYQFMRDWQDCSMYRLSCSATYLFRDALGSMHRGEAEELKDFLKDESNAIKYAPDAKIEVDLIGSKVKQPDKIVDYLRLLPEAIVRANLYALDNNLGVTILPGEFTGDGMSIHVSYNDKDNPGNPADLSNFLLGTCQLIDEMANQVEPPASSDDQRQPRFRLAAGLNPLARAIRILPKEELTAHLDREDLEQDNLWETYMNIGMANGHSTFIGETLSPDVSAMMAEKGKLDHSLRVNPTLCDQLPSPRLVEYHEATSSDAPTRIIPHIALDRLGENPEAQQMKAGMQGTDDQRIKACLDLLGTETKTLAADNMIVSMRPLLSSVTQLLFPEFWERRQEIANIMAGLSFIDERAQHSTQDNDYKGTAISIMSAAHLRSVLEIFARQEKSLTVGIGVGPTDKYFIPGIGYVILSPYGSSATQIPRAIKNKILDRAEFAPDDERNIVYIITPDRYLPSEDILGKLHEAEQFGEQDEASICMEFLGETDAKPMVEQFAEVFPLIPDLVGLSLREPDVRRVMEQADYRYTGYLLDRDKIRPGSSTQTQESLQISAEYENFFEGVASLEPSSVEADMFLIVSEIDQGIDENALVSLVNSQEDNRISDQSPAAAYIQRLLDLDIIRGFVDGTTGERLYRLRFPIRGIASGSFDFNAEGLDRAIDASRSKLVKGQLAERAKLALPAEQAEKRIDYGHRQLVYYTDYLASLYNLGSYHFEIFERIQGDIIQATNNEAPISTIMTPAQRLRCLLIHAEYMQQTASSFNSAKLISDLLVIPNPDEGEFLWTANEGIIATLEDVRYAEIFARLAIDSSTLRPILRRAYQEESSPFFHNLESVGIMRAAIMMKDFAHHRDAAMLVDHFQAAFRSYSDRAKSIARMNLLQRALENPALFENGLEPKVVLEIEHDSEFDINAMLDEELSFTSNKVEQLRVRTNSIGPMMQHCIKLRDEGKNDQANGIEQKAWEESIDVLKDAIIVGHHDAIFNAITGMTGIIAFRGRDLMEFNITYGQIERFARSYIVLVRDQIQRGYYPNPELIANTCSNLILLLHEDEELANFSKHTLEDLFSLIKIASERENIDEDPKRRALYILLGDYLDTSGVRSWLEGAFEDLSAINPMAEVIKVLIESFNAANGREENENSPYERFKIHLAQYGMAPKDDKLMQKYFEQVLMHEPDSLSDQT